MNLQTRIAFEGNLESFSGNVQKAVAGALGIAAETMARRAVLALRADTRDDLGDRIANTWRTAIYPVAHPRRSFKPSALVFSKAPQIVSAFAADTVILPRNARALAIPTANVPRRRGRRMTPVEVEASFNQDLIIRPGRKPGIAFAYVNAVQSRNGKTFRPPTKGRARQGRKAQLVLMFIFVQQIHLRKRLNYPDIFREMGAQWQQLVATTVAQALAD